MRVVLLEVPVQLSASEKAGGVVEQRGNTELVQVGCLATIEPGEPVWGELAGWHFEEHRAQLGASEMIAQAEGPFIGDELVQHQAGGLFEEVELFGCGGNPGWSAEAGDLSVTHADTPRDVRSEAFT